MGELTPEPSMDPQGGDSKKKIYIAVGALAAVVIVAWAVFIAPSSGTKGFLKAGETYSGSADPYSGSPNPLTASAQPTVANPFSGSAQPYSGAPEPFSPSASKPPANTPSPFPDTSKAPADTPILSETGVECDAWVSTYAHKRSALIQTIETYNDTMARLTSDTERMKANIKRDRDYTDNMVAANKYYDDGYTAASLTYATAKADFDAFAATQGDCSI